MRRSKRQTGLIGENSGTPAGTLIRFGREAALAFDPSEYGRHIPADVYDQAYAHLDPEALENRWADWAGRPFADDSREHVSVYRLPAAS